MKNVDYIKNYNCTGCGGCSKICPTSAISIVRNEEGFFSPKINNKCVECGLCVKVCYKAFEEETEWSIEKVNSYLAYSKNHDVRYRASSGGIGEEICKFALNNDYEVCGVVYDYEKNIAKHIITNDLEDIKKIVGSKYIPSYTEEAFKGLNIDKKYIIIGTPCQIYSIRKYMKFKKVNNWILIDFFCHGTPSLNLWDKYLDMIKRKEKIKKIKYVNFRDKRIGWHKFSITINDDKNTYSCDLNDDYFMNCFLKNVDLQEACYTCKLRFNKIYSDIRLGDFWGPKCSQDEKGTSIVLINTKVGEKIFESLSTTYKETISYEDLKISQYIENLNVPREKDKFKEELKTNKTLEEIYRNIITPIKKREKRRYYIRKPLGILKRKLKKFLSIIMKEKHEN